MGSVGQEDGGVRGAGGGRGGTASALREGPRLRTRQGRATAPLPRRETPTRTLHLCLIPNNHNQIRFLLLICSTVIFLVFLSLTASIIAITIQDCFR